VVDELDRYRQGYLVRSDMMLRDELRFYVGYTDAPESSDGFTVETKGLFGGLNYDVNARFALRASIAHERRLRFYDRTVISIGSSFKF
jgi:YaiO family outer membrane protein